MESKRSLLPCPTCGKLMWATEQGRGGTKREQPRIEAEETFSQIASLLLQTATKGQIEVADL